MFLRHGRRWTGAAVVLAAGCAGVWAQEEVPHPECSYFGPQRDRYLRGGLTPPSSRISALTEQVVATLPPSGAKPSRSRPGGVRDTSGNNYIDPYILQTLSRLGIPPAELATDAEFLRRVTLDLAGRIPTGEAVVQFLADGSPDKRARVIDELLERPEWADRWAMFFGDLYRNTINTAQLNRYQQARDQYHYYILDSLRGAKSYKEMARELIADGGDTWQVGQANFTLSGRTTGGPVHDNYDQQAVNAATVFLGMSHLDCVMCHDGAGHLETLTLWGTQARRSEAYGMAAFFARTNLTLPAGNGARPWSVVDLANGNYNLNTTSGNRPPRRAVSGQTFVPPRYMFGGGGPEPGENWRAGLARLVTDDFQFARATVNYLWKELMVVGLVEPADQFDPLRLDPDNPPRLPWSLQPSNPRLLDTLARKLVESGYDLKALMRDIANSRAYQLSSRYGGRWNPEWERLYARRLVRRLRAEEAHDAVVVSSGVGGGYTIQGFREPRLEFAMQLPDVVGMPGGVGGQLLDAFLRGNRQDDDRRADLTVQQALTVMNSGFVYQRARNVTGTTLFRLFNLPNNQLVDGLYLNTLSRLPSAAEKERAVRELSSGNRSNKAEDLAWSLYNKVDFLFNY